jgi:hypothetical protein
MRRRDEVKLNYRSAKSGKIYVSLEDIIDILENYLMTGKTDLPYLISELKSKQP